MRLSFEATRRVLSRAKAGRCAAATGGAAHLASRLPRDHRAVLLGTARWSRSRHRACFLDQSARAGIQRSSHRPLLCGISPSLGSSERDPNNGRPDDRPTRPAPLQLTPHTVHLSCPCLARADRRRHVLFTSEIGHSHRRAGHARSWSRCATARPRDSHPPSPRRAPSHPTLHLDCARSRAHPVIFITAQLPSSTQRGAARASHARARARTSKTFPPKSHLRRLRRAYHTSAC